MQVTYKLYFKYLYVNAQNCNIQDVAACAVRFRDVLFTYVSCAGHRAYSWFEYDIIPVQTSLPESRIADACSYI